MLRIMWNMWSPCFVHYTFIWGKLSRIVWYRIYIYIWGIHAINICYVVYIQCAVCCIYHVYMHSDTYSIYFHTYDAWNAYIICICTIPIRWSKQKPDWMINDTVGMIYMSLYHNSKWDEELRESRDVYHTYFVYACVHRVPLNTRIKRGSVRVPFATHATSFSRNVENIQLLCGRETQIVSIAESSSLYLMEKDHGSSLNHVHLSHMIKWKHPKCDSKHTTICYEHTLRFQPTFIIYPWWKYNIQRGWGREMVDTNMVCVCSAPQ